VSAILKASVVKEVGKGEVFNVGAGEQTSINVLAKMIGGVIEYVPPRIEPKHTLADINETTARLGWRPTVVLADGIAELKQQLGLK
jgi:UDP-glucose 4-epimerase